MSLVLCFPVGGNPWFVRKVIPYALGTTDKTEAHIPLDRQTPSNGDTETTWSSYGDRFLCGSSLYVHASKHPSLGDKYNDPLRMSVYPLYSVRDQAEIAALPAESGFWRLTPSAFLEKPWDGTLPPLVTDADRVRMLEKQVGTLFEVVRAMANRGSSLGDPEALLAAINQLEQEHESYQRFKEILK